MQGWTHPRAAGLRRISLPSGGWWAIRTRPTWQDAASIGDDETSVERLLVVITEAWGFDDAVSLESISHRDEADLAAAFDAIHDDVLPWLDWESPEELTKDLFVALCAGQVPERFFEAQLMAATGWSWQTLQNTPADVVIKMALFLAVSRIKEHGGALRFPANLCSADGSAMGTPTEGREGDDK